MKKILLIIILLYLIVDEITQPILYNNISIYYKNTNNFLNNMLNNALNISHSHGNAEIIYYEYHNISIHNNLFFIKVFNPINLSQAIDIYSFYITFIFLIGYLLTSVKLNLITLAISVIYLKFLFTNIIYYNYISHFLLKLRRAIIWFFTSPLILYNYCEINKISYKNTKCYYDALGQWLNIMSVYLLNIKSNLYYPAVFVIYVFEVSFILNLMTYYNFKYTRFLIYVWGLFFMINILDLFNIYSNEYIDAFYSLSDMICKVITIFVVSDNENYINALIDCVDLESIQIIRKLKKELNIFQNNNKTKNNKKIVEFIHNTIDALIPEDKTPLKTTLLKKILPLNFDNYYLTFEDNTTIKKHENICVFFSDIVSYTEFANKYDETTVFNVLNDVYKLFDNIISKIENKYLQKIETIGDAYMIVGDLYHTGDKTEKDIYNVVIKMIIIGIEFINKIKDIQHINNEQLSLRIGLYLGNVAVGILGSDIPRMSIVGNTVNMASRLQSTADENSIQIHENMFLLIKKYITPEEKDKFIMYKRQNVTLKNIGTIDTYIIKPINFNENISAHSSVHSVYKKRNSSPSSIAYSLPIPSFVPESRIVRSNST